MSDATDSAGADADAEVEVEVDSTEPTDPDAHGGPTLSALAEEAAPETPRDEE